MIDVLLKVNIPLVGKHYCLPYGSSLYFTKLTMDYLGYGPYYSQWTSTTINIHNVIVGAIRVDQESYTQKPSLSDCEIDDKSFFWNDPAQTLFIHYEFGKTPDASSLLIGLQNGYSYIGLPESFYINDIEYQPRITTMPTIKKKVDKFQAGKMTFTDQSISLFNGDGALDDFIQNPIPGSEGSIVLYDTEEDTELEFYTGFITLDTSTYDSLKIKLTDKRRRENVSVPNTLFDDTTYPYMESKYIGDVIPEGYGQVKRIEAFPTNGDESAPTYISFKYATDATVLTSVEVKDDDVWTDVTSSVVNSVPSSGSFDLPYATATNTSGAVLSCVVTATLRSEENPGDIIEDMNERYNSVAYDATNYNTSEWTTEKAKLADVALYMDKEQEYFKWIEVLQNGSDYWFLYDIEGDGTRTLRVNDPDRSLSRAIEYIEIKDDKKSVERDFEEFSSTVAVLYDQDIEAESFDRIDVDDYEESVLEKYLFDNNSEFETLLVSSTDAQFKADLIAEDQSEARPVITVTMHENDISELDLKLYDIVTVDTSKPDTTYFASVDNEVYFDYTASDEIYFDYSADDEVLFSPGETINKGDGREYYGTIRGQITAIGFNPSDLSYTLSIRERPESEVT